MARTEDSISKTTHYRRIREAKKLGCKVSELPDKRGKHNNHVKAGSSHLWNNEKMLTKDGYVKLRVGLSHPLADSNGYAYEHLIIWVSAGNPRPQSNELLHHKNEIKSDNRYENLELKIKSGHSIYHNKTRKRTAKGRFIKKCSCCDRGGEYNGFSSDGPLLFICPKNCSCHD